MSSQAATQERAKIVNGVNVSALMETIDAVKKNPEIAKFRFRGRNTWLGGDHNRSTIKEFHGACEEQRTAGTSFVIDNGEPPVLLGEDKGANPVEHLLNALMGCMTTTTAYHAASRGIEIEAIDTESEGDIDLRGFLGLSDTIRKGYQNIRVKMRIKSSAKPETLRELAKLSPVFDVVSNSVPVDVVVETY
jgi:uncharacterized OsmC-like protein